MPSVAAAVALAKVSRRQHGAFTHEQARLAGFSKSSRYRRVRSGLWIPAHRGVLLDAASPRTHEQAAMAACLACGDGALASHVTAGILLGLGLPAPDRPDVTVPPGLQPRLSTVRVYRPGHLAGHEVARVRGVPVTSAMRTLADLAGVLDPLVLEIALDTLWRRGSVDPSRLADYLRAVGQLNRRGTGVLRALVIERIGQRPPGSDLETVYIQILKRYNVPLPVRQHAVMTRSGRRFIDLCYPAHHVAIELEGFDRHGRDRRVFDDDHIRRNDLRVLNWNIREFTWTQCTGDPVYVAVTTAEAIGLVPVRWRNP